MEVDVCNKCNKEVRKEQRGSLTQWIFDSSTCSCRRSDIIPVSEEKAKNVCPKCFNQKVSRRSGSITQWIFRQYQCRCSPQSEQSTDEDPDSAGLLNIFTSTVIEEPQAEESFDTSELPFPEERYKPLSCLGKSAASVVYKCFDRQLGRTVAIKTLLFTDSEVLVRFQQEARATGLLRHANIVEVLDFGASSGGSAFMVLEYVDADDLEEWIQTHGPFSESGALTMIARVCRALDYAHSKGIYHRDLKPQNILINRQNGEPKLIDFGLALVLNPNDDIVKTQGLSLSGTPSYMSPDQFLGRPYDVRSEIYSLGCVLFACVTGSPPFHGETALEIARRHAEDPAPTLKEFCPEKDFSEKFEGVIHRCLEKNPADRYSSIPELAKHLGIEITGMNQESTLTSDAVNAARNNDGSSSSSFSFETDADLRDKSPSPSSGTFSRQLRKTMILLLVPLLVLAAAASLFMSKQNYPQTEKTKPAQTVTPVDDKVSAKLKKHQELAFNRSAITHFDVNTVLDNMGTDHTRDMLNRKQGVYADTTIRPEQMDLLATSSPQFYYLGFRNCDGLTPDIFNRLKSLHLTNLRFSLSEIDNSGLAAVASLPHIKMVEFENSVGYDNQGYAALKKSKTLTALVIRQTKLDAEAMQTFSEMHLSLLNLDDIPNFDEQWLVPLASTKIFDLRLDKLGLGDSCIPYVLKLPELRNITLRHMPITDKGVEALCQRSGLLIIDLEGDKKVTDGAVQSILSVYEKCTQRYNLGFNFSDTSITVKSVPLFKKLKGINHLELRNLTGIDANVAAGLRKALPGTKVIISLDSYEE